LEKASVFLQPLTFKSPVAVIFLFHTVETEKSPWTDGHRYITPFSAFRDQIRFINQNFKIKSTSVLIEKLRKKQVKENIAAVHFDDGFRSYKDIVLPYLKRFGIPSTVFLIDSVVKGDVPIRNKLAFCLNTGAKTRLLKILQMIIDNEYPGIDLSKMNSAAILSWIKNIINNRMEAVINEVFRAYQKEYKINSPFLNKKEVLQLKKHPDVEIGSHTVTHPMLSSIKKNNQKQEIVDGHKNLEKLLAKKLYFFAYPHGGVTHFDDNSRIIIKSIPELVAFSTFGGINYKFSQTDMKRITLTDHSPLGIKTILIKYRLDS
ncbi:MAG: polysaccharide deacetylase family protein, partial [Spirochaetes bacterium]|nr:polysaccharide deacetylase family protein [Spirochaetota bacterium]